MSAGKLLVYLLRRDLRVADNPILNHLASALDHGFTHLLPIYVFPSHQIETSGFLDRGETSPYPPAVSSVGKFWRCGPHRAKFLAESVWDLKASLEGLSSGLVLRVGNAADVSRHVIQHFRASGPGVGAVWMTEEFSHEEAQEQGGVAGACADNDVEFKLWLDEKYFIDDRDINLKDPSALPDVFTAYRKSQEPLREKPRRAILASQSFSLPPLPDHASIPPQAHPFTMPESFDDLVSRLLAPLDNLLANPPPLPPNARSAHPFHGGETLARDRLQHIIKTGVMTAYNKTRNGLMDLDCSTKLSGYLALGCITARQIHEELLKFEDGTESAYAEADGFGKGENEGAQCVRFELLWRDYMRLCTKKFGRKLFRLSGFRYDSVYRRTWKSANKELAQSDHHTAPEEVGRILKRFLEGTTGMGLIDASQRELFHTGYTANRARQNVASFFAKHLGIDWRYGAEWYEMMLVDYDVSSNWSNWQYVAGVGNDPRGDTRIFNPVKQGFNYDKEGTYVRAWVPELKGFDKLENVFQLWTASQEDLEKNSLTDSIMVVDPLRRIDFTARINPRPRWRGSSRRARPGNGGGNRCDAEQAWWNGQLSDAGFYGPPYGPYAHGYQPYPVPGPMAGNMYGGGFGQAPKDENGHMCGPNSYGPFLGGDGRGYATSGAFDPRGFGGGDGSFSYPVPPAYTHWPGNMGPYGA